MMYEGDKPFTRLDRTLFSRLAAIVSLELQKKRFFKNNRGVMYSYFLADLLNNGTRSHQNAGQRLQVMGFTLKERLYVMVVDAYSGRIKGEPHLEVIAHQLHWILVGSMYVIHSDHLVLLISRSNPGITEHEFGQAKTYLEENALVAGVSSCFADISDIQRHYRQALKAREFGERVLGKAISHYGETSLFHMFSLCEEHESLLHFCSEKLLVLLKHDREHKTEFTRTLYQYLLCSQNSLKTAAILNIHKNTLLYRVEKIKRIADVALDGGEELMELQISFHILRYLKQI
jgi:sugar diacid utilization regulator